MTNIKNAFIVEDHPAMRQLVMKRHIPQLLPAMRKVLAGGTYLNEDQ